MPRSTSGIATTRQRESDDSDVADLVPRVTRKTVQSEPAKTATADAKPIDNAVKAEATKTNRETKTAVAAIGLPQPTGDVSEQSDTAANAQGTLSATVPTRSKATSSATRGRPAPSRRRGPPTRQHLNPENHPILTPLPRQDLSLSPRSATLGTPASTISHRSGPPSQAFAPEPINDAENNEGMAQSNLTPINSPTNPVGSGVAPKRWNRLLPTPLRTSL